MRTQHFFRQTSSRPAAGRRAGKLLRLALAAVCCCTLLTACGPAGDTASTQSGSQAGSSAVTETGNAGKTITVEEGIPYVQEADGSLSQLGEAIAPPAEWANQDLAGRNTATTLSGEPEVRGQFISDSDGWLTACYDRGDTYVYKTADGGATWTEVTKPGLSNSVLDQVGFLSADRLILAGDNFNGVPVLMTKDGGQTWEKVQTPNPLAEVASIQVSGQEVVLEFEPFNNISWRMTSSDLGDTWTSEQL